MLEDFVGENDITSVREIPLDNGNKLYLKRTDPYGFFRFNLDKGQIPEWMRGEYTSLKDAQKAVQQYLNTRRFDQSAPSDLTSRKTDKRVPKA